MSQSLPEPCLQPSAVKTDNGETLESEGFQTQPSAHAHTHAPARTHTHTPVAN